MDFREYQKHAMETAIYPGRGTLTGLLYAGIGLGEAGEAQNKIKKILRDDNGVITPQRRKEIGQELGGNLWYIAAVCSELGININDIAVENLAILNDRKSRGVLSGSGDER